MRNRASSFRGDLAHADGRRWYRERWPWFLAAGPFIVVIACFGTAWVAVKSDDGLVAQDYYKQGLLINQRLRKAAPEPVHPVGAVVTVGSDGQVRAHLEGRADTPPSLRLRISYPANAGSPEVVALDRDSGGDYLGTLAHPLGGRRVVTLEADAWRLPTTTVDGALAEIRLGTAGGSR